MIRIDITAQQYNILRILRGAGKPISTLQIRERMLDKMSDTSRIVDRLILKGLCKKNICKDDKRLVDVTIRKREKIIGKNGSSMKKRWMPYLDNLSEAEAKTLNKLLDKIRDLLIIKTYQ